jgi:hypothetical protein
LFQRWWNEVDAIEFFTVEIVQAVVIVGWFQVRCQAALIAISRLCHDLSTGRRLGSVDVRQSLNFLLILAERLFSDGVLSERLHEFRTRGQLLHHVFQIDTGFVQLLAQSLFQVCVSRGRDEFNQPVFLYVV